jgi:hypothetical protein
MSVRVCDGGHAKRIANCYYWKILSVSADEVLGPDYDHVEERHFEMAWEPKGRYRNDGGLMPNKVTVALVLYRLCLDILSTKQDASCRHVTSSISPFASRSRML